MKNKRLKQKWYILSILIFASAFVIITLFQDQTLAIIGAVAILGFAIAYFVLDKFWHNEHFYSLAEFAEGLGNKDRNALENLPVAAVLAYTNGTILWYNNDFASKIAKGLNLNSTYLGDYLKSMDIDKLFKSGSGYLEFDDKCFSVFVSNVNFRGKNEYLLYFFDISVFKEKAVKYDMFKPAVLMGMYDNFDEMFQNLTDSELSELTSALDKEVSKWFSQYNGVFRKLGSERFVVICHETDLQKMIKDKFSLLGKVRDFIYNDKPCLATLSIGVGKAETLKECDLNAKQALDMALSRGGDQVAIKNFDNFDFYGGISAGTEKGNKVRSRVVASSIRQLIVNSQNCIIVGHKFADFDAVGTAIGIYSVMKYFGKEAHIVYEYDSTLAEKLVSKYVTETGNNPFIDKKSALQKLTDDTIVFLVDTHRVSYCESPEIINNAKTVVVIDHHRKAVDYFDNAVVFHHNSSASSASEMFVELLPYLSNQTMIGPAEADALLAGIMLDTKNFILRAGARTFDAASYLKSKGADSVKVKKLFASSTEEHRARSEVMASTIIYKECAIAATDIKHRDIRIITSQAADELLNISGVKASFVIFKTDDTLNISARSFGELNVQLVMEKIGGGGHLTMAAAQLKNTESRDGYIALKKAIDNYFENL